MIPLRLDLVVCMYMGVELVLHYALRYMYALLRTYYWMVQRDRGSMDGIMRASSYFFFDLVSSISSWQYSVDYMQKKRFSGSCVREPEGLYK